MTLQVRLLGIADLHKCAALCVSPLYTFPTRTPSKLISVKTQLVGLSLVKRNAPFLTCATPSCLIQQFCDPNVEICLSLSGVFDIVLHTFLGGRREEGERSRNVLSNMRKTQFFFKTKNCTNNVDVFRFFFCFAFWAFQNL